MLGHRELTMEDYADILKRRWWILLLCAIALCAAGSATSYILPPRYVSQTLVLIEQQQVPEDYVKPVLTEDLQHHLASMKEQILSRSRIQPIIERFNLFAGHNYDMDERVARTQAAIGIRTIPSARDGLPGFYITFQAPDPHIAQQACSEITSLFVNDNLREREQSAEGTTDFLKQQLADSKRTLDEQDAKLAAFQQEHFGMLPDQQSSNADTLQALTTQLNAATESLNRLQQNETFLQTMISQQAHAPESDAVATNVQDDNRKQLEDLIEQKQALETLYTPDYPDVVAISRKIADLQAAMASAPLPPPAVAKPAVKAPDSPQLQQLKAQLRVAQQSMADEKLQQGRVEQQIRTYEARMESTPRVDQEYKQITRDHDSALQFYNSLLAKMNESSMATALEQRQQGEQFRVMDAANLPEAPTFPNHLAFAGEGLAGGLFLGLILVSLLEYLDVSLRNERDVWAFTKLPTLGTISRIQGLSKNANRRRELIPANPMESASN